MRFPCPAGRADYYVPRIIGIDSNQFAGGRTDFIRPVVASVRNTGADIQCVVEDAERDGGLIEISPACAEPDDFLPLVWRLALCASLPDLEAGFRVQRAGVQLSIEDGHRIDRIVTVIAEVRQADFSPFA